MDMQMTFYWGYDATILFSWWQCSTALDFYISCFCIFALCLVSSKLKAVCRGMQKDQPSDRQMIAFAGCSTPSVATAAGNSPGLAADQSPVSPQGERWRATPPLLQATLSHSHSHFNMDPGAWAQVSQQHRYDAAETPGYLKNIKPLAVWLLIFFSVMIDWAMMLVCMTFNGGLFLAVVCGVATGQMLLQHKADSTADGSTDCCSAATHG